MYLESSNDTPLRRVLSNLDLRLLLAAGLVSQTGDWILATGIAFQIYLLTGSTAATALALLATQIPQVLLGSPAGVLVDRWDRRWVMVLVSLVLAVVLVPLTVVHDVGQVWIVYLVVVLSSCLSPFFLAAEASLLPALVARPDGLVTANAANAQVGNIARLLGAALGGIIVASGGLPLLGVADIASFVLAALLIGLIRHRPSPIEPARLHLLRDWVQGLRVIRSSRDLSVVLFFFAIAGVGEAAMGTLFAPFVHDILGGTARTYGTILSAQAVGGIVGGILVTALGHRVAPRALFGWGATAFGLLDLALFLYPLAAPTPWPAIALIALVGLPAAALSAGMLTIFQLGTTDQVRGRVYGTLNTAQNLAMLSSTLLAGGLAATLGIVQVIAVQGAVYVIAGVVILIALRSKAPVPVASPV